MSFMPSFIQSAFNDWADRVERAANWDEGHKHESGTQQEWDARTEHNRNMFKKARVLRWAGVHYVNMES